MIKEGYLLKRKGKRIRKIWIKRYAALEGTKLNFYESEDREELIKSINLAKIQSVTFHYDENAPVQSKNIGKKDKEESRFDLYTLNLTKKYKFKALDDNVWDSESWVKVLKEAIKEINPDYQST